MIKEFYYKTIIFDCDGVILNSNQIKTLAFGSVTNKFGVENSKKLMDYHVLNGGVSRYVKFKYFIENILNSSSYQEEILNDLLSNYSTEVKSQLIKSEVCNNLHKMRALTNQMKWMVISGGDQNELREVFKAKQIYEYFDGGIFGSPDSKIDIVEREISLKNILFPALFLGDSKFDYQVATTYGIEFAFISQWSEFENYEEYCKDNKIKIFKQPYDTFNLISVHNDDFN